MKSFSFFKPPVSKSPQSIFQGLPSPKPEKRWGISRAKFIRGDFFKFDFRQRFHLIYERTFLCALRPRKWPKYAKRVAQLLQPRGRLADIFFYGKEPEPPPYPLSEARAAEIFGKYFRLIRDVKVSDSVAMFAGMERWQECQLRVESKGSWDLELR